mgnify:CR=1 FL=1
MEVTIKSAKELSEVEIKKILSAWGVNDWMNLSTEEFQAKFQNSKFYLLYDNKELGAILRINYDFEFQVKEIMFQIPELVGFVSLVQSKGYGKHLIQFLRHDMIAKDTECIGFCYAHNRGFYQKSEIEVLEDKAKFFYESIEEEVIPSDDDDILNINLKPETISLLKVLDDNNMAMIIQKERNHQTSNSCITNHPTKKN